MRRVRILLGHPISCTYLGAALDDAESPYRRLGLPRVALARATDSELAGGSETTPALMRLLLTPWPIGERADLI